MNILFSQDPEVVIASPRFGVREKIKPYILEGEKDKFPRARAWERHYLEIASKTGSILFWLPGEEMHDCEKVYGAMTRVELGQWMTNYRHDNSVRFCVGTGGNFPEMGPIKYDLSVDAPEKIIFHTLEETCAEAIRLSHHR